MTARMPTIVTVRADRLSPGDMFRGRRLTEVTIVGKVVYLTAESGSNRWHWRVPAHHTQPTTAVR